MGFYRWTYLMTAISFFFLLVLILCLFVLLLWLNIFVYAFVLVFFSTFSFIFHSLFTIKLKDWWIKKIRAKSYFMFLYVLCQQERVCVYGCVLFVCLFVVFSPLFFCYLFTDFCVCIVVFVFNKIFYFFLWRSQNENE